MVGRVLTGREHFYRAWQARVRRVVEHGPVLDIGTPARFHKDLAWLRTSCAQPYFTIDRRFVQSTTLTGDACALPIGDATVGAVICQHVMNYLLDPKAAADEMWRVLRPGGRAYVSLSAVAPYTGGYHGGHGDVVRFTPASAGVLFDRFTDVEVMPAGGLAHAAWNYLPRRARVAIVQRLVDALDPRIPTRITMAFYVFATR